MVLVPPYIEVDDLVVPLRVELPVGEWPARALVRAMEEDFLLEGFQYAMGALIHMPSEEVLALLHERKDVLLDQALDVSPVRPGDGDDWGDTVRNWELLTGYPPDLKDVYFAGASFVNHNIVIPTSTFIKLMTRIFEINDALREGRMEPRIDDSIPIPPPRPPPPPPRWTEEQLRTLEDRAEELDQIDPLTQDLSDEDTAQQAKPDRVFLLEMLAYGYKRTRAGEDDLPARFAELELPELLRYHAAFERLGAYLHAPERIAMVEPTVEAAKREAGITGPVTGAERAAADGREVTPFTADVSLDVFRLPGPPPPDGVSELEWLARCEAVFLHSRITGAAAKGAFGDMFTRILGHSVRMRYRTELAAFPVLWRVELV